ncbi:Uncharacterized protein FWK35_00009160 [Aphis craccivora]|uniref:Uncharacterized protein n=1 Tax=Aphis craccivora TaxID=307492 RepID=A0A6G0Y8H5_APHCR|nr:Uncharacterized protein FWK35_00009160 [Aphis craccivora]
MTSSMHQLDSFCYQKPPPKFEIEALFRHVLVYTDTRKKNKTFSEYFINYAMETSNNFIQQNRHKKIILIIPNAKFDILYLCVEQLREITTDFLDSERKDECIDFIMMCVFLCLSPRFGAVKVLRFLNSVSVSDRKVNLVGTLISQNNHLYDYSIVVCPKNKLQSLLYRRRLLDISAGANSSVNRKKNSIVCGSGGGTK